MTAAFAIHLDGHPSIVEEADPAKLHKRTFFVYNLTTPARERRANPEKRSATLTVLSAISETRWK